MTGLRRFLEAQGYATWSRTYPSRRRRLADLADWVAAAIRRDLGDRPIIGITHSMGGIIARHLGKRLPWRGLVMMAPPNTGSRVAAALEDHPLYGRFFGPALADLADPSRWPPPPRPFAVIAGTRGASLGNIPSWLIRALSLIPAGELHDGTVTAAETRLPGMSGYAEVPASHTFMMNHPRTRELILEFLRERRFGGSADRID
jgi:pimeloyl-ACP methyl ester carboxylesterase